MIETIMHDLFKKHIFAEFKESNKDTNLRKYEYAVTIVKVCPCGKREIIQRYTAHEANNEASEMMHEACAARGIEYNDCYQKYGSYFYCELRSEMSRLIDAGKSDEAKQMLEAYMQG